MNNDELCKWVNDLITKRINKELKSQGIGEGYDNSNLFFMVGSLTERVEEVEYQIKKLEERIVDVEDLKNFVFPRLI